MTSSSRRQMFTAAMVLLAGIMISAGVFAAGQVNPLPKSPNTTAAAASKAVTLARDKQIAAGKVLFTGTCSTCHQPDGAGMAGVFPPLAKSDYIASDPRRIASTIIHGMSGPVKVNGKDYNSLMPPMAQLTDDEVANISTYVLNSWGNPGGQISRDDVKAARAATPANGAGNGH